jgi:hypothetical protein
MAVPIVRSEITMKLSGGCNCGQVRYQLDGEPIRVGVCHCETCRKDSGSAFSFFGVWPRAAATLSGELGFWRSRAGGERFCRKCGSSLFSWDDDSAEIEIKLGTLDAPPTALAPAYELWTSAGSHGWRISGTRSSMPVTGPAQRPVFRRVAGQEADRQEGRCEWAIWC